MQQIQSKVLVRILDDFYAAPVCTCIIPGLFKGTAAERRGIPQHPPRPRCPLALLQHDPQYAYISDSPSTTPLHTLTQSLDPAELKQENLKIANASEPIGGEIEDERMGGKSTCSQK